MSTSIFADRVLETTVTQGTGTYSLAGPAGGARSFVSAFGSGSQVAYAANNISAGGTDWEIGIGTITSGSPDTLSRDTILASSNSGAAVNWGATFTTKQIFCAPAADVLLGALKTHIGSSTPAWFAEGMQRIDTSSATAYLHKVRISGTDAIIGQYNPLTSQFHPYMSGALLGTAAKADTGVSAGAVALVSSILRPPTAVDAQKAAGLAAASTTDIWAATVSGNLIHVSGAGASVTSFGSTNNLGAERTLIFDSVFTIVHNAAAIDLQGKSTITTQVGDRARVVADGTALANVIEYTRASGAAIGAPQSNLIQTTAVINTAVSTGTTTIPTDDSPPLNTEGDQYLQITITPTNANNKLIIEVNLYGSPSAAGTNAIALFKDSVVTAIAAAPHNDGTGAVVRPFVLSHYMIASTTSQITFSVRAGGGSGTFTFNGAGGGRLYGGVLNSIIKVMEVAA